MPYNVWNAELAKWVYPASFKTRSEAELATPEGVGFKVKKVPDLLEAHGTKLMQLKPSMIWRCAMDDIERKAHNRLVQTGEINGDYKQYAFHRRHVAKAETANDILRAAIEKPGIGKASGKRGTRLLYSDVELLKAALQ